MNKSQITNDNNIDSCNATNLYSDFISQNKPCKYAIQSDKSFKKYVKAFSKKSFQEVIFISIMELKMFNETKELSYRKEQGLEEINLAIDSVHLPSTFAILNQNENLTQINIVKLLILTIFM